MTPLSRILGEEPHYAWACMLFFVPTYALGKCHGQGQDLGMGKGLGQGQGQ